MNNTDVYLSKRKLLLICFCFFILIGFLIFVAIKDLGMTSSQKRDDAVEKEKPQLVNSASKFYTVSGCIDKYLLYLANGDTEKVYTLLNPTYIDEKGITSSNVLELLPKLPTGEYTFNSRKMYSEVVSNTVTKYYVFGYIVKQEFLEANEVPVQEPAYFIVTLDSSLLSFSIMPYDGAIFK